MLNFEPRTLNVEPRTISCNLSFMNDQQFRQLLDHLDLSWKGFRRVRKGVKKRIRRHMRHLGCEDLKAYLVLIDKDPEVRQACELRMTVTISRFFRDRILWQVMEREILPRLLERVAHKIKVWSAGCACGEEVYTLKMVWDRLNLDDRKLPALEILASDMNPVCLNRAREGLYSSGGLKETPDFFKEVYFKKTAGENQYTVKGALKKDIAWRRGHLLQDPPLGPFHIVFLRNNLLTYYKAMVHC